MTIDTALRAAPPAGAARDGAVAPELAQAVDAGRSPEFAGDALWTDLRYVAALIGRYLLADRVAGTALVVVHAGLGAVLGFVGFQLTLWGSRVTDRLVGGDAQGAWHALSVMLGLYAIHLAKGVVMVATDLTLRIRWRNVFTDRLATRWLADDRYHWMQRAGSVDHPEQRIQEDLAKFGELALAYVPGLITVFTSLALYLGSLWTMSASAPPSGAAAHAVPGYLVPAVILVSIVEIVFIHRVGNRTTRAELVRQRLDAIFRHDMALIRENAEAVALLDGGPREYRRVDEVFQLLRRNWRHYTAARCQLYLVNLLPNAEKYLVPMALAIPMVGAGTLTVGGVQLLAGAYRGVKDGLMGIVSHYVIFAELRAAANRLQRFERALEAVRPGAIGIVHDAGAGIRIDGLDLLRPDGTALFRMDALDIAPGARVLVRGSSGTGKSTLLRAIAGLWRHGAGTVRLPAQAVVKFLPQRPYMPPGTIKALLAYPEAPDEVDDQSCIELLDALALAHLGACLHTHAEWAKRLSPGEQQRLAAVRVILAHPDYVFLDEATSALDAAAEARLYELLLARLPRAAIVSVAHRPRVAHFHHEAIEIAGGRAQRRMLDWGKANEH